MNDFDDRLRSGVTSGGDDVPPTPPFADVERRARRMTRRRRAMAGGALIGTVAVVAGIVAMQRPDDEDGHTVVVTQPDTSTSTTTTSSTSTIPTASTTTTTTPIAGPPDQVVLFDSEARELLVVNTRTGDAVEVLDTLPEGSQLYSLDVADDGSILYTTSVDAMRGTVHRVRRGHSPEAGPPGTWVAAGPDGRIVTANEQFLTVYDELGSTTGTTVFDGRSSNGYRSPHSPEWSADGRWIVAQVEDGLLVIDTTLQPGDRTLVPGGEDRVWSAASFRSDGGLVVFEHTSCAVLADQTIDPDCIEEPSVLRVVDPASGDVLRSMEVGVLDFAADISHDSTSDWMVLALADGTVRWSGESGSGAVPNVRSQFADWMRPTGG